MATHDLPVIDATSAAVVRDPSRHFARLRLESPIVRIMPRGFYGVLRHADVTAVLEDAHTFSNRGWRAAMPAGLPTDMPLSFIELDGPVHTRLRRIIAKTFTPKLVAALEPRVREIVRELVTPLAERDSFELVDALTTPLPMIVIAEMLGVEPARRGDFKRWSALMIKTMSSTPYDEREVFRANFEFINYFGRALDDARKRPPAADLVSQLARAEEEGEPLSRADALGFLILLLVGGNETTTNTVGNAMVALATHPDVYAAVRADRALVPDVIEETMRWLSPLQYTYRLATRDTDIGGVPVPAGTIVAPLIAAANRDPAAFADPDRFDPARKTKHLAFGAGSHYCPGTALSRLEARVALEALAALGPLELAEPDIVWAPSLMTRGPERLRLRRAK